MWPVEVAQQRKATLTDDGKLFPLVSAASSAWITQPTSSLKIHSDIAVSRERTYAFGPRRHFCASFGFVPFRFT